MLSGSLLKQLEPVQKISTPVSGSARYEMSGTRRKRPGRSSWKRGLRKTPLRPPPEPKLKPRPSVVEVSGGTSGVVNPFASGGFVSSVKFVPQPVWKPRLPFLFKKRLVPPTPVAQGELAG